MNVYSLIISQMFGDSSSANDAVSMLSYLNLDFEMFTWKFEDAR